MTNRVKWPLVVKLIAIISLIVLFSMGAVTGLATWFFSEDTRVRAEEQNLTLNELVSSQMESEVASLYSGVMSLLDTLIETESSPALADLSISNYFNRNARMIFVGVPGKKAIYNKKFFEAWNLEESVVPSFMDNRGEAVDRARAGETLLVNASPWIGVASAALLAPYKDLGGDDTLVMLFSTETLQNMVRGDSVYQTYVVGDDGGILAHSDYEIVKIGVNMKDVKIVEECIASTQANMQMRFTDGGAEYIGAFRKVSVGEYAIITAVSLDTIYSAVKDVARQNLYITGIVLLFSILSVWFFSKTVSKPVMALVGAAKKIEKGDYSVDIMPTTSDELGLLTESFAAMGKGLAERERIKDTFGKFVNREIAEQALTGNLHLGGVRKTATIMFSDIR